MWTLRKLTLKGKVTIVNTLIMSQIIYLCTVIHMPEKFIKRFKEIILKFIWNGKPAKVKYSAMINKLEAGGLKLHNIDAEIKSLKYKWIKQMCK